MVQVLNSINSKKTNSLQKIKPSLNLISLKYNNNFCNKILQKNSVNFDNNINNFRDSQEPSNLIYDLSRIPVSNTEAFSTIIDLLLQLRAAQDDQNITVQNNTVLKEQIINQLKNEILRVSNKLTKQQIKDLEVVSSNNFDPKELTDLLNSFINISKKKSQSPESLAEKVLRTHKTRDLILKENFTSYKNIISRFSLQENKILNSVLEHRVPEKKSDNIIPEQKLEPEKFKIQDKKTKNIKRKNLKTQKYLENKQNIKITEQNINKNIFEVLESVLPVIKLKNKISEIKLASKTKLFVKKFIDKKISKILPSETELVDKIIRKSQIQELKENINLKHTEYAQDRSKYQREIKNINTQIKNIQDSKIISRKVTDILKNTRTSNLNIENIVKKNINKFMFNKENTSGIKLISENIFKELSNNQRNLKYKFINKKFVNLTQNQDLNKTRENINIEHKINKINKTENISENYNKINQTKILKNNNIIKNQNNKISNILSQESVNKIHRKINNSNLNIIEKLDKEIISPEKIDIYKNIITRDFERKYENILNFAKYKNIYKLLNKNKFEISKNKYFDKSRVLDIPGRTRIFKINQDIKISSDKILKNINKPEIFEIDKSHIIHKIIKAPQNLEKNKNKLAQDYIEENHEPNIIIEKKVEHKQDNNINTKDLEKNILSQTLNKDEIVDLIESYMKNININSISSVVIDKIERKISINNRRRGII